MNIHLKKTSEDDISIVLRLEQSVASKTFHAISKEDDVRDYIKKSHVFLVLNDRQEPIGTISYETKEGSHVHIDGMTVLPKYQRKGIASQALELLLARLEDVKRIDLLTHPHNAPALCVYLKFGFVIEAWKDDCFGDGEPRLLLVRAQLT